MKLTTLIFGILVGVAIATEDPSGAPPVLLCKVCPSVIGFLEKMTKTLENAGLDPSQIVQQLKPAGDKFCDKLFSHTWYLSQASQIAGKDAREKCRQVVDEKLPRIVEDVQSHKPVTAICDDLFRCSQLVEPDIPRHQVAALVQTSEAKSAIDALAKKAFCKVCPSVVSQLQTVEDILTGKEELVNPTEVVQMLQPYADKICDSLPLSVHVHDVCRQLVDNSFPQIVQGVVNNERPERICSGVFGCPPDPRLADADFVIRGVVVKRAITTTTKRPTTTTARPSTTTRRRFGYALNALQQRSQSNGLLCSACQKFSQLIEGELQDTAFQGQLEQSLQSVCEQFQQGELQTKCFATVQQFVPQIFQQLTDFFSEDKLCGKVCGEDSVSALLRLFGFPTFKPPTFPTFRPPTFPPISVPSRLPTARPTWFPFTIPTRDPSPRPWCQEIPTWEPPTWKPPTWQPPTITWNPPTWTWQPPTFPTWKPTIPTWKPTIPTWNPTIPSWKPSFPTWSPTFPTVRPTFPTWNPTIPTVRPTFPTIKPTFPTWNPTFPTIKPSIPTWKPPSFPTFEPTFPTWKPPTFPTIKPSLPTWQPTFPTWKPTESPNYCLGFSCKGRPEGDYADPKQPCANYYCSCCKNSDMFVIDCFPGSYFNEELGKCVKKSQVPACNKK